MGGGHRRPKDRPEGFGAGGPLYGQLERGPEVDGLLVAGRGQPIGELQSDLVSDRRRLQEIPGPLAEGVAVVERGVGPARDHADGQQHAGHCDEDRRTQSSAHRHREWVIAR